MTDPQHTRAFYRTALLALLAHEQHERTTRRFGPEADAAWSMFHGHLDAADRIDLLIRDAAVRHPAAFAPRTVFGFRDLPEDEPFGPRWSSPYGKDTGKRAWQEALALADTPPSELWSLALEAWNLNPARAEPPSGLDPTTRILVLGAPTIAALGRHFLADRALDWGRQVTALSAQPVGVQLAGILPLIAGSKEPARAHLLTRADADEPEAALAEFELSNTDLIVCSKDGDPIEEAVHAALRAAPWANSVPTSSLSLDRPALG